MKKLFIPLIIMSVVLLACKTPEPPAPELGSVKLNVTQQDVVYGQEVTLIPEFSATGTAKSKNYTWKSSNSTVATVDIVTGGYGKVTAKRIGEAVITYISDDGAVSATCKINVGQRSNIMGPVFYQKGADKTSIVAQERGTQNTAESTKTLLVYDQTPTPVVKISKIIYELGDDEKLKATYAIVNYTPENKISVEQFIEERYQKTAIIKGGINYYEAGINGVAAPKYASGTMVGIFLETSVLGIGKNYPLGVKYVDQAYIQ